ncbi:ATP-dependent DNA ligase [Nakamurella sp. A5-74]|uniref:DNA ligase (ATP) n=1 Tax=Nakamurella sp. A5-74 TaxID=3158264 RepID=A0AAU8DJA8_9ACTN
MDLPVSLPIDPMLAKAATRVPDAEAVPGGYAFEPKWDGFRCLVVRDGDEVELASRGSKPLTRYFPDVVEAVRAHLPARIVLDCEIVVRSGEEGAQRLDFDALSQRIHPAESRVRKLAVETPAELIAFDLLALGDENLMSNPFGDRRSRLEDALGGLAEDAPIHLTRITTDTALAQEWFETFEGAGLDGVVAKPLADAYQPGKRAMLKIKHQRTADVVIMGYRIHKSGEGVGSLLVGLYNDDGELFNVGGVASFTAKRRVELIAELEPYVDRTDDGAAVRGATEKSRYTGARDVTYVRLRPELVIEVGYNQMEQWRFRHPATLVRFRPDREAGSCLFSQIDRAVAYDLDEVLTR